MRDLKCRQCGKLYTKIGTDISNFCSRICKHTNQTRFHYKTVCLVCLMPFNTTARKNEKGEERFQRFCSLGCKKTHSINKRPYKNCIACGKTLSDKKQILKFCSKQCGASYMSVMTTLSDPNLPMQNMRYKYKGLVFHGLQCQRCGWNKDPRALCVHHKKGKKGGNSLDNLEVLCNNCHAIEHCKGGFAWKERILSVIKIRDLYIKSDIFKKVFADKTGNILYNLDKHEESKNIAMGFIGKTETPLKRTRSVQSEKWWKGYK